MLTADCLQSLWRNSLNSRGCRGTHVLVNNSQDAVLVTLENLGSAAERCFSIDLGSITLDLGRTEAIDISCNGDVCSNQLHANRANFRPQRYRRAKKLAQPAGYHKPSWFGVPGGTGEHGCS